MKTAICKRALALSLAALTAAVTLCATACGYAPDGAEGSAPEAAYPLLTEKSFNADGEQESEEIYTYDAEGRLIGSEYSDGESVTTSACRYEKGRLVRKTDNYSYGETHRAYIYEYQYDADGLLQEMTERIDGEYAGKTSFMRGSGGKIKRVITYDADNQFKGMIEHRYDAAGNCIEEKEYDAQSMTGRRIYRYDGFGRLMECMVYDKNGFTSTISLSYDGEGRMKSRTDTMDGVTVQMIYDEAYDDNGNCVKESAYYWHGGKQDDHPAYYIERTYGREKVPVTEWEFKETLNKSIQPTLSDEFSRGRIDGCAFIQRILNGCRFHRDFLLLQMAIPQGNKRPA